MKDEITFCRTGFLWLFLKGMERVYPGSIESLSLPNTLLCNKMRLMPVSEILRCFSELRERTGDDMFVIKGGKEIILSDYPSLSYPIDTSQDLFTAIMRLNSLVAVFQSGTESITTRSANILKWCYNVPSITGDERLYDSIVAVWVFIHILKSFHSTTYTPVRILLPGSKLGKSGEVDALFGCAVDWNQKEAQVWFPYEDVVKRNPKPNNQPYDFKMDKLEIMTYIDLPKSNDFLRCIYELINYAKEFEFPNLNFIASIIEISPQQLQRKLQKKQISFTALVNHQLLCNQAPNLLPLHGIEVVANKLGYKNAQSFTKAFKRVHGLTPRQYLEDV
ncbi:AraC family transcriptional regulator ligand-binding domain-containing protein [Photobacterium sagamiensis]|uniref:AraC family transcriptional regulator n=1 Tax=Photobacterium sagamiensis TaxID=2910241 RepID=UPI003D136DE7